MKFSLSPNPKWGSVCEEERISDSCMTNESWLITFANGFKLTQKPC